MPRRKAVKLLEELIPKCTSPLEMLTDDLENGTVSTVYESSLCDLVPGSVSVQGRYPGIADDDCEGHLFWMGTMIGEVDYKSGRLKIFGDWPFNVKLECEARGKK